MKVALVLLLTIAGTIIPRERKDPQRGCFYEGTRRANLRLVRATRGRKFVEELGDAVNGSFASTNSLHVLVYIGLASNG